MFSTFGDNFFKMFDSQPYEEVDKVEYIIEDILEKSDYASSDTFDKIFRKYKPGFVSLGQLRKIILDISKTKDGSVNNTLPYIVFLKLNSGYLFPLILHISYPISISIYTEKADSVRRMTNMPSFMEIPNMPLKLISISESDLIEREKLIPEYGATGGYQTQVQRLLNE